MAGRYPLTDSELDAILGRALDGITPDRSEIPGLLSLRRKDRLDRLFQAARQIRHRFFGSTVYLYGFVYFSTYCRNNCRFCHFRASNRQVVRYRKSLGEIIDAAGRLADAGVHLIDLTMGEDPAYLEQGVRGYEALIQLIKQVKIRCQRPVMISAGVIPEKILRQAALAGADWYACYQETHNRSLFARLRPGQDYDIRWQAKTDARRAGLLVEEGLLAGVGEQIEDISSSIAAMRRLDADQVRMMTFVPRKHIPLTPAAETDTLRERVTLAVMRLVFPDRLIPASLDIDGLSGLTHRLDAGANVVTSLILPGEGLAGVAHRHLDIEAARRTPAGILPVLENRGLTPASLTDYISWMERRQSGRKGRLERLERA